MQRASQGRIGRADWQGAGTRRGWLLTATGTPIEFVYARRPPPDAALSAYEKPAVLVEFGASNLEALRRDYEKMRQKYFTEPVPFDSVIACLGDVGNGCARRPDPGDVTMRETQERTC